MASEDYAATLYEKLGIDRHRPLYTLSYRPVYFSHGGEPIKELFLMFLKSCPSEDYRQRKKPNPKPTRAGRRDGTVGANGSRGGA